MVGWKKFKQSLPKISTKDISANYNDGRIIGAKDLLTLAQIYKDNKETIIVMYSKKTKNSDRFERIEKAIVQILDRLTVIETRLDNIETRLDKHEQLFRSHVWIK